MKNMKYRVTLGIALVGVILFTACDNVFEPPEVQTPVEIQTPLEDGYGRISISLVEEEQQDAAEQDEESQTAAPSMATPQAARTVLPSTVFNKYVYTFTKAGEEIGVEKTPDSDGFFTMEIGSYTVEVQAYTGTAENYTLVANGVSSSFSVSSGSNTSVKVSLSLIAAAAQGKFSYTITYPAGAAAEFILQKWPELNNIPLTPVNVSSGDGKTQTLQLEEGSYLFTVLVTKNELYAGISEAVHIYPLNATEYTKNFVDGDMLTARPPLPGDYTISGIGEFVYDGSSKTASVIRKTTASTGAVTVYYEGAGSTTYAKSTTAPVNNGTYTVTFDIAAAAGFSAAAGLPAGTITIDAAKWGIRLSDTNSNPLTSYTFPEAALNYVQQTARTITVTNTGNQATGALTIALSGTGAGSFTLSTTSLSSFTPASGTTTFTVRPNNSLAAGTYTATVTVSGGNGITASFTVSFKVNPSTYGISLNRTGTQTITSAMEGYAASSGLSVNINNTGNQATGALTVALSGTSAGSFTLSSTSLNSIAAGGSTTGAFTVVPKTGLAVGAYTAAVTVSGSNSITASFNVSFTVTVDPSKIVFGQQLTGSLSATTTSNQYKVVLAQAGRLSVNITSPSSGGVAYVNVYWDNGSGETIKSYTGKSFSFSSYDEYMDLEAGTYYIRISRYNSYNGTYNLTATFTPAHNTEFEPNNTRETSDTLMSGEQVRGFISHQDDTDWYRMEFSQAGRLSVNITSEDIGTSYASIYWYNSAGETIKSYNGKSFSFSSYGEYMDLEAGTYYIQVSKYNSYTGTYNLRTTFTPANNNDTKPHNTRNNAQTLSSGQLVRGFISHQNDTDWYKMEFSQAGRLSAKITSEDIGTSYASIYWYNSAGVTIKNYDGKSFSFSSYGESMDLEAGTYYIQVSKYNSYTGTYNLRTTFTPANNNDTKPHNARENAQLIMSGELVKGFISYQNDIDMYRVALTQAGRLSVNIITDDIGTSYASIYWYDSAGVTIKSYNGKSFSFSSYGESMDLEAGTYYIQVSKYNSYTGTYILKADFPSSTTQTSYTVTYNANNGSEAPSVQIKHSGTTVTLSNQRPTRSAYNFQGWATTSSAPSAQYQPGNSYTTDANVTLYAVWQAALSTYTVSYNANGGLGAPTSQTKTQGTALTLSSAKPTKTSSNFLGWAAGSTADVEQYYADGSYTNDASVTLYAVWHSTASSYTVTYNANGGTGAPSSQTKTHGTTLILDRTRPTRGGYTFVGWANTNNAATAQYPSGGSYTVEANRTLYAVWK